MKFKTYINEQGDRKLLISDNTIWFTYAPNSGIALPMANKTYLTDKNGDSNYYPNILSKMVDFAKTARPIKEKKNLKLYSIPVYKGNEASEYDIWGGSTKPIKEKFVILSTGKINILTIFGSKKEALNWIKTTI